MELHTIADLSVVITRCRRCARLVRYREEVGQIKRRAYADQDYWSRPVPGFGDPSARLWIVGLAPGAHGANRTGRVFTGDRSGDFLFAALHRAGFANQPTSIWRDDGLALRDCYISATCRCAPPGNKPLPIEVERCSTYLDDEWRLLDRKKVILALGRIAWNASIDLLARHGLTFRAGDFAHEVEIAFADPGIVLIGSYHVSQQNTFTGRLTASMFDRVLSRCRGIIEA